MTIENENQVLQELRIIRNLLALLVSHTHNTLSTKANALVSAGISAKEIASLLDSTPNAVSVAVYAAKKAKKKSPKAR